MAVKIRLARRGRKKLAMYDVIVADARSPRDGRIIEKLGTYNPLTNPATIMIKEDRALDWLLKGAQPTDTVRRILSYKGIMFKKHLQVGVLKEAITQEQADKKFEDWLTSKEAEISGNMDVIAKKKADAAKARLDAEKKVNEAKAEALKKKLAALVPPPVEKIEEEPKAEVAGIIPVATKEKAPTEKVKAEKKVEEPKAEATEKPVEKKEETPAEKAPVEEAKAEEKVEEPKAETTEKPVENKEEAPAEEKKEEKK